MAWFISSEKPRFQLRMEPEHSVLESGERAFKPGKVLCFVAGEYYTDDPDEIKALRASGDVIEATQKGLRSLVEKPKKKSVVEGQEKPWAADHIKELIHNLNTRHMLCDIPDEIFVVEWDVKSPWTYKHLRLYRRLSDARRWNKGYGMCEYCHRGK